MLLIDIPLPTSCADCRLHYLYYCIPAQGDSHLNRYGLDMQKRPGWCPIKEVAHEEKRGI